MLLVAEAELPAVINSYVDSGTALAAPAAIRSFTSSYLVKRHSATHKRVAVTHTNGITSRFPQPRNFANALAALAVIHSYVDSTTALVSPAVIHKYAASYLVKHYRVTDISGRPLSTAIELPGVIHSYVNLLPQLGR